MTAAFLLLGAGVGLGLALAVTALAPPRPSLAAAIATLQRPARPVLAPRQRLLHTLALPLQQAGLPRLQVRKDLAVLDRDPTTYLAGQLGGRFSKTYLLSGLYAARGVAIALLIAFPLTPMSAYLFAAAMGFLWLGTVPLTNGVVAGIFGVKHLAMLSGFVFFFHQLGSFFGGWLGGYLFDRTGSYQLVWLIAIGLSVISVVVNLPIDERPVVRKPVPA